MRLTPTPRRPSQAGYRRRCAAIGLALALVAGTISAAPTSRWTLFVDTPGVYALSFETLTDLAGTPDLDPQRIRLHHHGTSVPWWIDSTGTDRLQPGDRMLWLATRRQMWPRHQTSETSLAVLVLELDHPATKDTPIPVIPRLSRDVDDAGRPSTVPRAMRQLHFEQDLIRAPLTDGATRHGVETLWYWGLATERGSAVHTVHLGGLDDELRKAETVEIRVHLLGWSNPEVPAGIPQHQVDLRLNGARVGTSQWDGRGPHEARIETSATKFQPTDNPLTLAVPRRVPDGEHDPIIDLVYVDRVEVRYPVDTLSANIDAPLILGPSQVATWLPDPQAGHTRYLLAAEGWAAIPRDGGWIVPPSAPTEAWRVQDPLRSPSAILPMATEDPTPAADIDYLMIAPPGLRAGTERLATIHRERGLRVAVVSAHAIYDHYGFGARRAEAIRSFLAAAAERSTTLRYVLLVGDADWMAERSRVPYPQAEPAVRDLLPTWTELTEFGPAASDHPYTVPTPGDARPRFAIGRLPVTNPTDLEPLIDKIAAYLASDRTTATPHALLISDRSRVSVARSRRVARALVGDALTVVEAKWDDDRALDEQLVEALDRAPAVVHFSGHGSRHAWQLGKTHTLGDSAFFDRDDVARLRAGSRPSLVLSVSCATAPFDHPSAESLAEVMLQAEDRGAVAFVGASARLFTPPNFGTVILQALAGGETIGEAMVTAKRTLDSRRIAMLYNLLGDPALPLR